MAGLGRSRVFRTLAADNFRFFTNTRNFERSLHTSKIKESTGALRFSPRNIYLESSTFSQRRTLFGSKSEAEADKAADQADQQPEVPENEKRLEAKVVELEQHSADLLDKYRRSLADFENLRNRMNKQVSDAKVFGIQAFCKDLLDVADVMDKAVESVPEEALKTETHYLKDMHTGLKLTQAQLLKVFERHGLVQENPLGQKFDPNKHDAMFQVPDPSVDANTVVNVQKIGYILQGRTIRPAGVGVSMK